MSDIGDTVNEAVEHAGESKLNTMVAAAVAVTATFMALCNVKDGNVTQAMAQEQALSVDSWAYFQAKSTKQSLAESVHDQLVVDRESNPGMAAETRAMLDKKIAEYDAKVKKYETDKKEIQAQAEGHQKTYDALNVHDDQFDMAEASMSISIALFGVTALTQKRWLLGFAGILATFGVVLGLAGFLGWNLHPDWLAKLLS